MWPNYSPDCRKAVNDLLKKGGSLSAYRANPLFPSWTGPLEGSYAYRLEREIEKRFKVKHAIAVNSGTAALHAGLHALDLRGGEVITSPYTFSATASAILLAGGIPVFADVDPYTFCITPETVKHVLTRRTKAILPVSLFGGMADVRGLNAYGLPVLEDACQAVGARDGDGYTGTQGIGGAFSFNGGKNIPAGEAGAYVTQDGAHAEKVRLFMNHGENFNRKEIGVNYRMQEVVACIAYHGLLELEGRNRQRSMLANTVNALTQDIYPDVTMSFDYAHDHDPHVFYVLPFTLHSKKVNRDLFVKRMKAKGVYASGGYLTPPLHHFKAFKKYARGPLPVVEELSFKTLCLINDLTPDKPLSWAKYVAKSMKECLH